MEDGNDIYKKREGADDAEEVEDEPGVEESEYVKDCTKTCQKIGHKKDQVENDGNREVRDRILRRNRWKWLSFLDVVIFTSPTMSIVPSNS